MVDKIFQIKINSFIKEKNLQKKIPNSIITFFLTIQFVFGFNFGFNELLNKKIRSFCKVISLLIFLCTASILLLCTPIFMSQWDVRVFMGSLYFVQYCGYIILSKLSKYNVCSFITDIRNIDDGIMDSKEHKIGLFAYIAFSSLLTLAMMSSTICIIKNTGCMLVNNRVNVIYMISVTGLDSIVLVQSIVNFYTYYAIVYIVGIADTEKISFIKKQFFRVSKCCEKFGGFYDNLVSFFK